MYKYFRYTGPKEFGDEIYRFNEAGEVQSYRPDMSTINNGSEWDECFFLPSDMGKEFIPVNAEDIFTELI